MVTSKDVEELIGKLESAKTWQEKRNILIMLEPPEVSDPIVIQPLVDAMIDIAKKGEHRILRRTAVNLLGEIGGAEVVEPLIVVLLKSPTPDVRQAAAKALGKIEVKIGEVKAVGYLVAVLQDVNEATIVREEAARALGKIGDGKAVKPLTFVLKDENEDQGVREEIVEALGKIATEEAIVSLITVLDTSVGEKASLVLKQIGEPAVGCLISALDSESQTIRERVVTILGEIGNKKAVQPLLSLLVNENEDEYFRGNYVAVALGKIRDTKAVEPLIKLASKHTEDIITCMSVRALGDIGDHRAVEPLIAILEDERTADSLHSHLRLETCWALRKLKDPRAIEPLIKILGNPRKTTYGLEDAAASALVELDDDRIELPLLKYFKVELDALAKLKAPEHDYQSEVLEAVGKLITRLINKAKIS